MIDLNKTEFLITLFVVGIVVFMIVGVSCSVLEKTSYITVGEVIDVQFVGHKYTTDTVIILKGVETIEISNKVVGVEVGKIYAFTVSVNYFDFKTITKVELK